LKNYGALYGEKCGENRYIGVKNILEFYLTAGCVLQIAPRDAIQTLVRMEWTLKDFYKKGGTTKFVDRLCGSLGIHASTVKIVSVYEGSLIINYVITADDPIGLANLKAREEELFATGQMDLGAPILDVDRLSFTEGIIPEKIISGGVVTAKGYDPVILTPTFANSPDTIQREGGNS
jgi:hypothetical protein